MTRDPELSRRVIELTDRLRSVERSENSVAELEARVEQLECTCRALWGLLRDREELSEERLLDVVEELGARAPTRRKCPSCSRASAPRARACLYCGETLPVTSAFDL